MTENDSAVQAIIKEIEQLPENKSYTERGISPIFQFHQEAKILLVGQAPGKKVEESGIPFHDLSGKRLMEWMGISEAIFYGKAIAIVPMDLYYPGKGKGGDLPPRRFMRNYHDKIVALLPHIELRILIGKYAISHYDQKGAKLPLKELLYSHAIGDEAVSSKRVSSPIDFPLVHPSPLNYSWIKKNPWFMEKNIPLLQRLVKERISERGIPKGDASILSENS